MQHFLLSFLCPLFNRLTCTIHMWIHFITSKVSSALYFVSSLTARERRLSRLIVLSDELVLKHSLGSVSELARLFWKRHTDYTVTVCPSLIKNIISSTNYSEKLSILLYIECSSLYNFNYFLISRSNFSVYWFNWSSLKFSYIYKAKYNIHTNTHTTNSVEINAHLKLRK